MKENEIEKELIKILSIEHNQWTYRSDIKTEADLWNNLRGHINRINKKILNDISLNDSEFENVKSQFLRLTSTPFKASQWLRGENGIASIRISSEQKRQTKDIVLDIFSNKDICGGISSYEVVNQITPEADKTMRGDVTLLINGLPIIHIELKNEQAKDGYIQAFEQIKRYALSGFFDRIYATVQIFIISNKTSTKYFVRPSANEGKVFDKAKQFLFNWRTPENENIDELFEFTKQVLSIPMAHELVSQYTVLVDDKKKQKYLMALRPYQIHAIKKIRSNAAKHEGGYIWHATGSGKTITSFVATKLIAQGNPGVDRTIMVVDRLDLDAQTKDEFSKFASEYHIGKSTHKDKENALIVGIDNQQELTKNLLNKENNSTIIITTIQKISAAVRNVKEKDSKKLEKLKSEHIVFIVDECHRAVSHEQMKEIQSLFPNSTWFGFTGTPIFEENKKQENGNYARTTRDQFGEKLHAYTTKNALDDKSVLGFQVEYFSTFTKDSEEKVYYNKLEKKHGENVDAKLKMMTDSEKEALIDNVYYERDEHIEKMLEKIFKRSNVYKKFKFKNGYPTMSGILTTSSIAQAKRIYKKIMELKATNNLLNGTLVSERHIIADDDFPRVAITYSLSNDQENMHERQDELADTISDYNKLFKTSYDLNNIDGYNRNVNKRLERKEEQYKTDGQWLDLVIVVDRLLTGFDAPTVKTLYIDRELKWQKLLQAFSRTNRKFEGKDVGMIMTFRKPKTMEENVKDSIKLFSDGNKNWEELNSRPYAEILEHFKRLSSEFETARKVLDLNPDSLRNKTEVVKIYNKLSAECNKLEGYDEFHNEENGKEPDSKELEPQIKVVRDSRGFIENLKAEIKSEIANDEPKGKYLIDVEFTSSRDGYTDDVNSFYIERLLGNIVKKANNNEAKEKFYEEIKNKTSEVKAIYERIVTETKNSANINVRELINKYFNKAIDDVILASALELRIPEELLRKSYVIYNPEKEILPHMKEIEDKVTDVWTGKKEEFESTFGGKFRARMTTIQEYWQEKMKRLQTLKGEL